MGEFMKERCHKCHGDGFVSGSVGRVGSACKPVKHVCPKCDGDGTVECKSLKERYSR